jgi:hypothetical protein
MKYELNQVIYYVRDNKVHSAPVLSRMQVENLHKASTPEQKAIFTPFGENDVFYGTCHGVFDEAEVFPSRDALISFLCADDDIL